MLTVLGGLAEFERELIRARTGEGRGAPWRGREDGPQAEDDAAPDNGGDHAAATGRAYAGDRAELQRQPQHDFEALVFRLKQMVQRTPSRRLRCPASVRFIRLRLSTRAFPCRQMHGMLSALCFSEHLYMTMTPSGRMMLLGSSTEINTGALCLCRNC